MKYHILIFNIISTTLSKNALKKFVISTSLKKSQERQFKIYDVESQNRIFRFQNYFLKYFLKYRKCENCHYMACERLHLMWLSWNITISNSHVLILLFLQKWSRETRPFTGFFLTRHTVCDIIILEIYKPEIFSLKFWVFRGNLFESNQQFGYFLINRKKVFTVLSCDEFTRKR